MTRLITGLLLILGLAAPAAAQRLGPIPDPTASGRQWMREQQENMDRFSRQLREQQELSELQQIRQEIQRQGILQQQQEQQRQADYWQHYGESQHQFQRRRPTFGNYLNLDD